MVHFLGLLQLRLFNGLCQDFRTVMGLVSKLSSELFCGCYGLLCGMFCGHLYTTTGLEDQVIIAWLRVTCFDVNVCALTC